MPEPSREVEPDHEATGEEALLKEPSLAMPESLRVFRELLRRATEDDQNAG